MSFRPNKDKVQENADNPDSGGWAAETCIIPSGPQTCQFVGYVELGKVNREYNGKAKDPELAVMLLFEFAEAEHTGNDPLTWNTTRQLQNGDFFDFIGISDKLYNNKLTPAFMAKTSYMKTLAAMNMASEDEDADSIVDLLGKMYCLDVVHTDGGAGKIWPNMSIVGRINNGVRLNPVLDVIERDRSGNVREDYSKGYPARAISDCLEFSWSNPTPEAYDHELLKPWHKKTMKASIDYHDSALSDLLEANPDIDASADDNKTPQGDKPVDQSYDKPVDKVKVDNPAPPIDDDDIPF